VLQLNEIDETVRLRHERSTTMASGTSPKMSETDSRRTGIALVTAAAVAWSTAPFFTRLLHFDSWTILFWRGLFGGGVITAFLLLTQGRAGLRDLIETGKSGWLVACLSTLGMVSFIPALQLTSVSNVAIIIATGPFVAAGLAWIWLREAARATTLIASLVALCGVAIIVGNARGVSDGGGIGLACLMTLAIAAMTVAIRRYNQISMVAAAALSQPGQCPVRPRHNKRDCGRCAHPCDVRIFPSGVGPHLVCPRLPPFAVRAGLLDRDPGDTADALLGVAGISGASHVPRPGRRSLGDGGRVGRHHRR